MMMPARTRSAAIDPQIGTLSLEGRLKIAIELAILKLPRAFGAQLVRLLEPKALAVMTSVVILWAGLQFVGVGEVADAALLIAGWFAVGGVAMQGGKELIEFAMDVDRATNHKDIDCAARHLVAAISLLGVQTALMLLLHTAPKPYRSPDQLPPRLWKGWWDLGPPPRSLSGKWAYEPKVTTVPSGEIKGAMGTTSAWGDVKISSSLSKGDAQETLFHEEMHKFLTPKLYIFRELRVQIKIQGYQRSVILRYLEEAMAETYAQLRAKGLNLNSIMTGLKFPVVSGGYSITLVKAGTEIWGVLLGPINVGGMIWTVWLMKDAK